jgi:lipopolysaccharide/colanic/teichoic acid biosynthesis glycosyltransferase
MRYQSPATSPLAHYWEEEIAGFWGSWTRFTSNGKKFINIVLGDIFLANIYLVLDYFSGLNVIRASVSAVLTVSSRIRFLESFKRTLDIFGSIIGLMISLPIFFVVSSLIKLDSKGPVFYTQLRVGKNRRRADRRRMILAGTDRRNREDRRKESGFGAPFKIIKFRTMHVNAEASTGPVWATRSDPRVTRVGRVLRRIRVDEIPQLVNVLMGDMSMVGPRPERPFFVSKLDGSVDNYLRRFEVKPGITGLAQVEYKYDESIDDVEHKVGYDLRYIKNLSVVQDIRILLKTVIVVLTARGM